VNRRQIRATSSAAFRSREWATILGEGTWTVPEHESQGARVVYVVKFDDGVLDLWPVEDTWAHYEFRETP